MEQLKEIAARKSTASKNIQIVKYILMLIVHVIWNNF